MGPLLLKPLREPSLPSEHDEEIKEELGRSSVIGGAASKNGSKLLKKEAKKRIKELKKEIKESKRKERRQERAAAAEQADLQDMSGDRSD